MRSMLKKQATGGQVSWAEYDEELAWKLMTERRWVDVEDFASDCEGSGTDQQVDAERVEKAWVVSTVSHSVSQF